MFTLVLPGYSQHNEEWAEEVANKLRLSHEIKIHRWGHWSGGNFSLEEEIKKLINEIGKEKINIIAKSIGVYVAFNLIPKIPSQIGRVIFCGISSVEREDEKKLIKEVVSLVGEENILCIQNEQDKYVSYSNAEKFYHSASPNLRIISKPRADHEYPYFEDFENFLKKK